MSTSRSGVVTLGRALTWRGSSPTSGACPPSYRRRHLASAAPSPECATRRCRCSRTRLSWRWGLRTLADRRGKKKCCTECRIQRAANLATFVKPFPMIMQKSDHASPGFRNTASILSDCRFGQHVGGGALCNGNRHSAALSHLLHRVTLKMLESSLSLFTPRRTLSPPTTHILVCPQASLSLLLSAEERTLRPLMNLFGKQTAGLPWHTYERACTHADTYTSGKCHVE